MVRCVISWRCAHCGMINDAVATSKTNSSLPAGCDVHLNVAIGFPALMNPMPSARHRSHLLS